MAYCILCASAGAPWMARKKDRYKWRACVLKMKPCSSAILQAILETYIYSYDYHIGVAMQTFALLWNGCVSAEGCPQPMAAQVQRHVLVPVQTQRGVMSLRLPMHIHVLQYLADRCCNI